VVSVSELKHKFFAFSKSSHGRGEASPRRTAISFAVLSIMMLGAVGLYYYSRTFSKIRYLTDRPIPIPIAEGAIQEVLARATPHLIGMIACAFVLAAVSLSFQTITQSRVLTPSMVGFDSVFIGAQTLIVFFLGARHVLFANPFINYALSAGIMVVVSMLMFGAIMRSHRNNIVFLLMFGLVLSSIVMSSSTYLRLLMTEGDFFQLMARTSVNVNNMNVTIVWITLPIMIGVCAATLFRHRRYNVMVLGSEQAKGLGIHYERELRMNLILIAIGMSAVTALIGPLTFLGLLAVNAAREVFKTYKHLPLFIGSAMMSAVVLIAGQGAMEMIMGAVPVTVFIDVVGCAYVFYLVLKENRI